MRLHAAALLACFVAVGGCSAPISVDRVDPQIIQRELTASALTGDGLSEATRNVLRRWDLLARFDQDPAGAIAALHGIANAQPAGGTEMFALAETSYLYARRSGGQSYFLAAAVYAFAYLFPDDADHPLDPYDPRFREACDLYNLALAQGLRSPDGKFVELRSGRYQLPFGSLDIAVDEASRQWGNRELANFVPAAELQVKGLRNLYRRPGLGAPLGAGTISPSVERGFQVAPKLLVPTNALLVFTQPRRQIATGQLHAELTIHTIFDTDAVAIDGQRVPLEYDPSAVFALGLAQSGVWSSEYRGFLFGNLFKTAPTQLVALEPHRPGRIPVVLVHGTASSPGRWADMINDLLDDPRIEEHFEFWSFIYATGNPIPYSALQLRESLQDALSKLGGVAADPALGDMVVIGHSQGGLLAKMLVIDSGDRLWNGISRRRLAALTLTPETRDLLRRAMFVRPLSEIRRVVFIATPHRGSYVAGFSIAQLVGRLVTLPLSVAAAGTEMLTGNKDALAIDQRTARIGSIYAMRPGSPLIRTLQDIPVAPGVRVNSIIPVRGTGPVETGDDGVVKYTSAHIDGVESELVVRSGHSTQSVPATIEEVRRILLLHLSQACLEGVACAGPAAMR
ncbi:MAG TPA: alpha/beta hydrolase [Acetobacteraceae bacterium]